MQTANDKQKLISDDAVWYFLAEYSLSEFMVDGDLGDELRAGLLFQTIQGLGIPLECLQEIQRMLRGVAKEVMTHFNHEKLVLHVYIRLFYPKKTAEDVNSTETLKRFNSEETIEPIQFIHQANPKMDGGWGYFLIERGGDSPAGSHNLVDLYLYREGR